MVELTVIEAIVDDKLLQEHDNPSGYVVAFIVKLVEEGKIHPVIERSYSLDQAAEAMRYLGEGHAQGKVIIKVG